MTGAAAALALGRRNQRQLSGQVSLTWTCGLRVGNGLIMVQEQQLGNGLAGLRVEANELQVANELKRFVNLPDELLARECDASAPVMLTAWSSIGSSECHTTSESGRNNGVLLKQPVVMNKKNVSATILKKVMCIGARHLIWLTS